MLMVFLSAASIFYFKASLLRLVGVESIKWAPIFPNVPIAVSLLQFYVLVALSYQPSQFVDVFFFFLVRWMMYFHFLLFEVIVRLAQVQPSKLLK